MFTANQSVRSALCPLYARLKSFAFGRSSSSCQPDFLLLYQITWSHLPCRESCLRRLDSSAHARVWLNRFQKTSTEKRLKLCYLYCYTFCFEALFLEWVLMWTVQKGKISQMEQFEGSSPSVPEPQCTKSCKG